MILIACVDDRNGLQFHGRRLSRDRVVTARILERAGGRLWAAPPSAVLFPAGTVIADAQFLTRAGAADACFVETDAQPDPTQIAQVILYRWGRAYPADVHFHLPEGMRLVSSTVFAGFSHPAVTEEIYTR